MIFHCNHTNFLLFPILGKQNLYENTRDSKLLKKNKRNLANPNGGTIVERVLERLILVNCRLQIKS